MYSLKLAHLVKEKVPEAEVFEYYIDMRAYGKGYEEFYDRLLEEGTHFIRGRVDHERFEAVIHCAHARQGRGVQLVVFIEHVIRRRNRHR